MSVLRIIMMILNKCIGRTLSGPIVLLPSLSGVHDLLLPGLWDSTILFHSGQMWEVRSRISLGGVWIIRGLAIALGLVGIRILILAL